ncbi:hypothetical protein ABZP36_033310 [Zizania latifolia]
MEHFSFLPPPPPSVACSSFAQKLVALLSLIRLTTLATSSLSSKTRSCLISSDSLNPPPLPAVISRWKYCARIAHGLPAPVDAQLDPSVDDVYSVDASEQQDDASFSPPRTTDGSDDEDDAEADVSWDSRSRRQGAQTPAPCRCRGCRRHLAPSFPCPFFLPIAIIPGSQQQGDRLARRCRSSLPAHRSHLLARAR